MRFFIELATAIFLTIAAIFAFAKGANADGMMAMDAVAEAFDGCHLCEWEC